MGKARVGRFKSNEIKDVANKIQLLSVSSLSLEEMNCSLFRLHFICIDAPVIFNFVCCSQRVVKARCRFFVKSYVVFTVREIQNTTVNDANQ